MKREPVVFRKQRKDIAEALRTRTIEEADRLFETSLDTLRVALRIERTPRWRIDQFARDLRRIYAEERAKAHPEAQAYVGPMSRALAKLDITGTG